MYQVNLEYATSCPGIAVELWPVREVPAAALIVYAAVHLDHLAGHVAAVCRGKHGNDRRHMLRLAERAVRATQMREQGKIETVHASALLNRHRRRHQ